MLNVATHPITVERISVSVITDEAGTLLYADEEARVYLGVSRDDQFTALLTDEGASQFLKELNLLRSGKIQQSVLALQLKFRDNTIMPFSINMQRMMVGETGFSCVIKATAGIESGRSGKSSGVEKLRTNDSVKALLIQLETAQRIAGLAYLEYDFKENKFTGSPELYMLGGVPDLQEELTLDLIISYIHPEERAAMYEDLSMALMEDGNLKNEYRIILPDGQQKMVVVMGRATRDAKGDYDKFSIVIQDITDMRSTQLALQASENRFRYIFDNSADGILLTIPGGKVQSANSAICEMLGYKPEEILVKKRKDIFDLSDPNFQQAIRTREENGRYKGELKLLHKQGHSIDAEITTVYFIDAEGKSFHSTIIRDITEKKKQQQALLESEQQLRETADQIIQIIESISDGMVALNEDFLITYVNSAAERILGINREKLVGLKQTAVFSREKNPAYFTNLGKVLNEKAAVHFEEFSVDMRKWFELSIYPIGKGLTIYFRDITARKQQQMLIALEKQVLEINAVQHIGLNATINYFLKGLQEILSGARCSVMILEPSGRYVMVLAAPALSANYIQTIEATSISRESGSFGRAMLTRKTEIAADVNRDAGWDMLRKVAQTDEVRSSWSFPIISMEERVLGCLDVYFEEVRNPDEQEISIFERAANFLRLIIENKSAEDKIRLTNDRYNYVMKATNEAIYDWDLDTDFIFWGDGFSSLFGYDISHEKQQIGFWERCLHPEDAERIMKGLREFLVAREGVLWEEEYRFLKADNTYAYVLEKGFLLINPSGHPYRMVGSIRDLTSKKLLEKELLTQELTKQKLVAQAAIDAQEKERGQIGKELHDNINQILTTTKLYLELAKTDENNRLTLINRSAQNIVDTIQEIRQLSRSLVPPSIGDLGLVDSITDLIENVRITSVINIEFYPVNISEELIEDNLKLMLFRVVQEQINNVLKHAKANNLIIELTFDEESLELNINDDGIGFDLAKVKRGLGLSNINSRTDLFNGRMQVLTSPGKGCKLNVSVPREIK